MQSNTRKLLAPALSLTLLAAAFTFDANGAYRFWSGQPVVAVVLAAGSVALWILVFLSAQKSPQH